MGRVIMRRGREESLRRFHPWIFSGGIFKTEGLINEGDVVEVCSVNGERLGFGHYQIGSITVRMLSFGEEDFTPDFWKKRFEAAYKLRRSLGLTEGSTTAYRLIHGEGDSLPGLIVDIYNNSAVIQAHTAGMFLSRDIIVETLKELFGSKLTSVYDKSATTAPFKAGLDLADGYLYGSAPDNPVILENGIRFSVDWEGGQKTGFFLDQRDNRQLVRNYSKGKRVLNLFCYTGGFSLYALAGGAKSVDSVDSSQKAMDLLSYNVEQNREALLFPKDIPHNSFTTDAIEFVKNCKPDVYDLMIVDPPAFAKHRGALSNALRAYQRLNAAAIEKIAPGGIIFTYSCSQVVDKTAFAQAIFSAAAQTGRNVRILHRLTQPADHPVNIYHPEGEYLKGLVLYVD